MQWRCTIGHDGVEQAHRVAALAVANRFDVGVLVRVPRRGDGHPLGVVGFGLVHPHAEQRLGVGARQIAQACRDLRQRRVAQPMQQLLGVVRPRGEHDALGGEGAVGRAGRPSAGTDGVDGVSAVDTVRTGRWSTRTPDRTFTAERVVFAAGTYNTQKLLHRLRDTTLPKISARLGYLTRTNSEALLGVRMDKPKADYTQGVAITSSWYPD